jgi:acetyl esterase/lipase
MKNSLVPLLCSLLVAVSPLAHSADPILLWPAEAPGDKAGLPEEADTTKPDGRPVAGQPVIRLGNVSKPSITFYPAPKDKNTGTAVVVCPGGGYNILAWDLEGTEVCTWLNSIGVNAVLLKYRVPARPGQPRYQAPLQDAQRAIGLVRQHAKEWDIDSGKVGILGFSAGGHLAAAASTNYGERTYPAIDEADKLSSKPDFTLLIYPAYLTVKEKNDELAPELKVTAETSPTFIAMAQDDPIRIENALFYSLALKNAKVPWELHVYPTGGHGYGLRPSEHAVTTWPQRAGEWMKTRGLLKPVR